MFIYRRNNFLSPELCQRFIEEFEKSPDKSPGVSNTAGEIGSSGAKKSTDLTFNPSMRQHKDWGVLLNKLVPKLYDQAFYYSSRFKTAFENLDPYQLSPLFNLQRYEPGEGFYQYHCERAGLAHSERVFVWMVYLNTVNDGGHTEFYYQNHFEDPVQGKLVIWPSDWTHLHRGIVSETETKYILTGWFDHIPVVDVKEEQNKKDS